MRFSFRKTLVTSAMLMLSSLGATTLAHADSVAVQIDSKQSMTKPGDV